VLEQLSSRISVPVDVPFVPPTEAQPEACLQASVKFENTARPIIPVADAAAPAWFATPKIDTPFPSYPGEDRYVGIRGCDGQVVRCR
jgi:hypothetical protein